MSPAEITQHFYQKIPISKEIGIQVLDVSSRHARVSVPLKPNINHVQTAFGGSIYSAAALSCYALFQSLSQQAGGLSDELVIQQGTIRYLRPIRNDFTIQALLATAGDEVRFIKGLQTYGKARLLLKAEVSCEGHLCAVFEGIYVYSGQFLSKIKP